MANLYVREWFTYPGVWMIYILILFFSWLVVLSIFGWSSGMAWTFVHLSHSVLYISAFTGRREHHLAFADDQGIYNMLTWWEQIDSGKQLTPNRNF